MGYDIWLEVDTGGEEPAIIDHDTPGNHTYNTDAMWALALDDPNAGVRDGYDVLLHRKEPVLERFRGRLAGDCVEELTAAIERMESDPDRFREFNPENGWGSYETAIEYLRRFRDHCAAHPKATVAMWL